MFTQIVTGSLRNRVFVLAASLLLVLLGSWIVPGLQIDVLPDLNRPTVTIQTESHGLAPQEVEQLVTLPIEAAVQGLPGVTRVRSVSSLGLSFVYVEFAWGAEIYRARQQVAERLSAVQGQLPDDILPAIGPISSVMGEIMLIAVAGEKADPMLLRETAQFGIRPQLLAIPGVSQVIPIGGLVREFRVAPDPQRMRQLGISLDEIEAAVRGFASNAGGGFIEQRRIGDRQRRQVGDHRLVVEQGLQTPLGDLRLVGRVLRVPAGVLQNVAPDDRRRVAAHVPLADEGPPGLIRGGDARDAIEKLALGERLGQIELATESDRGGHGLFHQGVDGGGAEGFEHGRTVGV